jgi:hypothetical protein
MRTTHPLAIGLVSITASAASAQVFSIDWHRVAGGGGQSSGGDFAVSGTIGQAEAGSPMTGGDFSLTGGFWAASGSGGNPCGCAADYNQDGGTDGADVAAFFADWEMGSGCADTNQDGGIDGADVATFFSLWEAGGC